MKLEITTTKNLIIFIVIVIIIIDGNRIYVGTSNKNRGRSRLKMLVFQIVLSRLDSTTVSIFVDILIEFTNAVFVNSTNITTNIKTAALFNPGRNYVQKIESKSNTLLHMTI